MKKKKAIVLILLAALLCVVLVGLSLGWFNPAQTEPMQLKVGKLNFKLNGITELTGGYSATDTSGNTVEYIVPGENLLKNGIQAYNTSSVKTNVRVKITYKDFADGTVKTYAGDSGELLKASFAGNWEYNSSDNYWHYKPGIDETAYVVAPYETPEPETDGEGEPIITEPPENEGDVINILSHLAYASSIVIGDNHGGKTADIKITFEAKQADHVEWSALQMNIGS